MGTIGKNTKDKVSIIQPLCQTDYGSLEFTIEDCNGYFICFLKIVQEMWNKKWKLLKDF